MKRSMRPWPAAAPRQRRARKGIEGRPRSRSDTARRRHRFALAWLHRRSPAMLPILGTLSLGHLRKNLAALEIELTDAELDALR
jgi:aryl-alcohol dehydrogenase-like predicted oxidoreductase